MKDYKFGPPHGRFIGNTENFSVYEDTIAGEILNIPEPKFAGLPGEFIFNYGPAAGGLMESVALDFLTPGELIKDVKVDISPKRRTLSIEGRNLSDALLVVERINGFHAASHSIAYEMAVEDALDLEVPEGVLYSRILMLELERIRSNLLVVKRVCDPAGFGVPLNQIAYLIEKVSRIISRSTGHRYFFSSTSIGGCNIKTDGVRNAVIEIAAEFKKILENLLESKIFLNRLQNNGKVGDGYLIGPAARSAGIGIDARKDSKGLPYSELGFKPVLFDEPDAFGRFYVRGQEILESADLVLNVIDRCKNSTIKVTENLSGEGAARIESPQGDLFYYVKINEGVVDDLQISSPSLLNLNAFQRSMKGNIFTDYHFNWESFGIWISELAVVIR
ncbi:MAG: Ni,Fe-hydrogenase III large subunit [Thermoplasmataceae archaeon]